MWIPQDTTQDIHVINTELAEMMAFTTYAMLYLLLLISGAVHVFLWHSVRFLITRCIWWFGVAAYFCDLYNTEQMAVK